jgi:putative FmdB family regulatory protein
MPFYEYQCSRCGHHHEALQKVGGPVLRKCPACGRSALRRLVSAPVFRLKGGGWYETDFKAEQEKKRNLAGEKEPAPAADAPAEKPKEEKAAAKPAAESPAKPAPPAKAKPAAARPAAPRRRRPVRRPRRQ